MAYTLYEFSDRLESLYSDCRAMGIDVRHAENILREEMGKAMGIPNRTSFDCISIARKRLIAEAISEQPTLPSRT